MQKELADVIITVGIAMIALADGDVTAARTNLETRLHAVTERSGARDDV